MDGKCISERDESNLTNGLAYIYIEYEQKEMRIGNQKFCYGKSRKSFGFASLDMRTR